MLVGIYMLYVAVSGKHVAHCNADMLMMDGRYLKVSVKIFEGEFITYRNHHHSFAKLCDTLPCDLPHISVLANY